MKIFNKDRISTKLYWSLKQKKKSVKLILSVSKILRILFILHFLH